MSDRMKDVNALVRIAEALASQAAPVFDTDYGEFCGTCPDNNSRYEGTGVVGRRRHRGDNEDPDTHDDRCAWAMARKLAAVEAAARTTTT